MTKISRISCQSDSCSCSICRGRFLTFGGGGGLHFSLSSVSIYSQCITHPLSHHLPPHLPPVYSTAVIKTTHLRKGVIPTAITGAAEDAWLYVLICWGMPLYICYPFSKVQCCENEFPSWDPRVKILSSQSQQLQWSVLKWQQQAPVLLKLLR